MAYWITGPNFVEDPPLTFDELDETQKASLKTYLQDWIGLDGREKSNKVIKEGKQYCKQQWGLKVKNKDIDDICREIVSQWS